MLRKLVVLSACLGTQVAATRIATMVETRSGSDNPLSDLWGNETKCKAASAKARSRCGFSPDEDVHAKCHACDAKKNHFTKSPSKTEHLSRQVYNYCPRGNLEPLEGKFHHILEPTKLYHYVDDACNCWTMLQVAESAFHKPWEFYKFIRVNPDCSSMEVVVPRKGLQEDCSLDTSTMQGGSFNFFDPGYSKVDHTTADVVPCATFGTDYSPPEKPCRPMPVKGEPLALGTPVF